MIRPCTHTDFDQIWTVINDGAEAYRGVIPADRWTEPYMPMAKLQHEIDSGVDFWGFEQESALTAVMGIQRVLDVTLIRHAYVRTANQKQGTGGLLLAHLRALTDTPILIGTWTDALWAIRFYGRHGFHIVDSSIKSQLLRKYWNVPDRQIDTSVVLADERWFEATL